MDLRQFERIERVPVRIRDAAVMPKPASKRVPTPATPGPIGAPGIPWLIGWGFLVWFLLILAVIPNVPIYRLLAPDIDSLRGFPGTEEWLKSSLAWFVRWGAVFASAAAVEGLLVGAGLWLMLRSRIRGARWLPLLSAIGAGTGTLIGYGLSVVVAFPERASLAVTNPELYLMRQGAIIALVAGTGAAVAMAWVLQRQLPSYGWWAAAWVLAFGLESLVFPTALMLGAGPGGFGAAAAFVGFPGFAILTGVATFLALRSLAREDRSTEGPDPPAEIVTAAEQTA